MESADGGIQDVQGHRRELVSTIQDVVEAINEVLARISQRRIMAERDCVIAIHQPHSNK